MSNITLFLIAIISTYALTGHASTGECSRCQWAIDPERCWQFCQNRPLPDFVAERIVCFSETSNFEQRLVIRYKQARSSIAIISGTFEYRDNKWNGHYPTESFDRGPVSGVAAKTTQGVDARIEFALFGRPTVLEMKESIGKVGNMVCEVDN